MKRMIKFPSIEQYRNIVKDVGHKTAYWVKDEKGNTYVKAVKDD